MDWSIKILKFLVVMIVIFAFVDIAVAYHNHHVHKSINRFLDDMAFYILFTNSMHHHPSHSTVNEEEEEESVPHYSSSHMVFSEEE